MPCHRAPPARRRLTSVLTHGILTAVLAPFVGGVAHAQRAYTADDKHNVPALSATFIASISRDSVRRDSTVRRMFKINEHLGMLALDIPEYHDEQPFIVAGTKDFGPMAYIFASPYLDGFTSVNQIDAHGAFGVFVATVWIDAPAGTTLPEPYAGLHLSAEMNCVYLAHSGALLDGGWSAFVLPGSESTGCTRPDATTPTLAAKRIKTVGFAAQTDYPGVARFDEDAGGRQVLGVRCLNAWCEIGALGFAVGKPSHNAYLPLSGVREGRIRGWHDDQMLSVIDPTTHRLKPRIRATVTPQKGLETMRLADFTDKWVRVATIWLRDDPTGTKYDKRWGMRKGPNDLEISFADGKWEGIVTASGNPRKETRVIVSQHKHFDMVVPGTARFRWRQFDEGVWVPCDQGCCRVDAIQ